MLRSSGTLLTVLLGLLTVQGFVIEPRSGIDNSVYSRFVCNGKENGRRILVPGSCSQYYVCQDGQSQLNTCTGATPYFDSSCGKCVATSNCVEGGAGSVCTTACTPVTDCSSTTCAPTTCSPTTCSPTTGSPTTCAPTTCSPTTCSPTIVSPTTCPPTTCSPTTCSPTTVSPTTCPPTTCSPTTCSPTTCSPTTGSPTTCAPTTCSPTTCSPTTCSPTTCPPTTCPPTTCSPTTCSPTTCSPTTCSPTTCSPTTCSPTTCSPTTCSPTTCATTFATPTCACSSTTCGCLPTTCPPTPCPVTEPTEPTPPTEFPDILRANLANANQREIYGPSGNRCESAGGSCIGRRDGTRIAFRGDCNKFVACFDECGADVFCPSGMHFNRLTQMCDDPQRAGCTYSML